MEGIVVQSVRLLGEQKRWDGMGWDGIRRRRIRKHVSLTALGCIAVLRGVVVAMVG
jgi:hypothetical protein